MKIIFFGSDDFAATNLEYLLNSTHEVVACVTHPDRPKNRGMKMSISPVKKLAGGKGVQLLQPFDLSESSVIEELKTFDADLFIVIAYGKKLPQEVLGLPKKFCINVHGSLLPKYRGAAPINWSIINGDQQTGVSLIKMNDTMDGGEVLAQEVIPILAEDNAMTLRKRMAEEGAKLLLLTCEVIEQGNVVLEGQKEEEISYAKKLTKPLGLIDWNKSSVEIHNMVRGLLPWPTAYTYFNKKMFKILESDVMGLDETDGEPGEVIHKDKEGFAVMTGNGALYVKKVHLEAAKPMDAASFLIGHPIEVGVKLGSSK